MQWKTVSTNIGQKSFGLWNNGKKLLTLAYKGGKSDTIYFETEDGNKRHFHYRKKGLFKSRIVLQNEYGVDLGEVHNEGNEKSIIVDNEKFYVKYKNSKNEVEIIDSTAQKPVTTCHIESENPVDTANYSLLMVTCLYLHNDQKQPSFSIS